MLFSEKHLAEELVEMVKLTFGKTYKEILHLFAIKSAEISGADRVCLIILNLKKQLVIKAGFPVGAHPINQVIFSEIGESFLKQVMKCRKYVLISNPAEDARTSYMKELARHKNITSILFMPLHSNDEPLGMLVFDFTAGKRIAKESIRRMLNLADLVVVAMAAEYEKRKKEKEWQHSERMVALGENAARTAHSIRNPLMTIGGFSKRAERLIEKAVKLISEKYPDIAEENSLNEIFAKLKGYHRIISSDIIRIEKILNGVLEFSNSP
ncbi:GAF domain-containing protein, partial [Patescibacteria group bacterium]|nr:GAF domain-containing protein [Patescibacteria group bacterium]